MPLAEPFDRFVLSVSQDTWEVFRRDPVIFLLASLVGTAISVVTLGLLTVPMFAGTVEMVRASRRGEPLAIGMLFSRMDTLVPGAIAFFIVGLGVVLGMLLLVIPGLVVALFCCWTAHVITYERSSGVDAIRRSVQLVRENLVHTLAVLFAVVVVSAIANMLVVGMLLAAPLTQIALTLAYERMAEVTPTTLVASSTSY